MHRPSSSASRLLRLPGLLALLPFATPLLAQTQLPLPLQAAAVDGHQSHDLPFGVPGFRTQVLVDAAAVQANTAVLTALRWRADRTSLPLAATSVPNVTVQLSHTQVLIGTMAGSFAANQTGTATTVFQGTVILPAHTTANAGTLPFDIAIQLPTPYVYTPTNGNLLIDITANNRPGGAPSYWLDAVEGGGSATTFGQAGFDPSFDNHNLIASTGNSLEPSRLVPGGLIEFHTTRSFTAPPGYLLLGNLPLPAPLELTPFGAPTHTVYVDPIAYSAHQWSQTFLGFASTLVLPIPSNPSFAGVTVYAQSALFEPTANQAGLLLTHALEVMVGDVQAMLPLQQLDARDPLAVTGTVLDFGSVLRPSHGAAALVLEGTFL